MNWYLKLLFGILILPTILHAQQSDQVSEIIQKIYELEKDKDPKCYATANRLEDFMYGTPLEEAARNMKIEIQKKLIYYLKKNGSALAKAKGENKISNGVIVQLIDKISTFNITSNGGYDYKLTTGNVFINKKDFNQYSSVSYGYRSLLSVEQDLLFTPSEKLLRLDSAALNLVNDYVNLMTLVVLKVSDLTARKRNLNSISKKLLSDSWILILNESQNSETVTTAPYPTIEAKHKITSEKNSIVNAIIKQKLASYKKYNNLAETVFLRNVQVYFSRQKWPTDAALSNKLRTYYLESLIAFSNGLLVRGSAEAIENDNSIVRVTDMAQALDAFLPAQTNNFEDVTFFPNSDSEKVSIESYDLDAFRDSGFHWQILNYSLEDSSKKKLLELDPNAAELLVEGIAQLGVLSLRIAGELSKNQNKENLETEDLQLGFQKLQTAIDTYDYSKKPITAAKITSSKNSDNTTIPFTSVAEQYGINFMHKSSDWLNRHIRSYTTSYAEGKIKLAIPPAFGGSGVACEDINNDGLPDILLLGGFGNKLYLNSGDKKFIDSTEKSNINSWNATTNSYGEPRQPIIADFNNDGLQDIFISYVNETHKIYQNKGNATFEDKSEIANLGGKNAVAGPATAFDYNNDGLLDIVIGYFGNYVAGELPTLSRDNQNGMPNKLFENLGDFKFKEVNFIDNAVTNNGWTQALGHADINQDGWQDIIEGNDFGVNKYYFNNGDGTFTEKSKELGTDKPSYTMNIGITDLNKDQFPDFYISNIVVMQKDEKYISPNAETKMKFDPKKMANIRTVEANDLFISNLKDDKQIHYLRSENIGRGYSATGWSWDADFFDFDNDGDEDLYCLNGMNDFSVYSSENPFYFERMEKSNAITYAQSDKERNVFFVNENGALINKAEDLGVDLHSNSRSAAYFDFDNDGDLDILINNYHETAVLYENNAAKNNNWIKIKLIGDGAQGVNNDAIGATILLNGETSIDLWREIHSTTGYLSVHPKKQHFGIGNDQKVTIKVQWSNGKKETITDLEANKSYKIKYPNEISER